MFCSGRRQCEDVSAPSVRTSVEGNHISCLSYEHLQIEWNVARSHLQVFFASANQHVAIWCKNNGASKIATKHHVFSVFFFLTKAPNPSKTSRNKTWMKNVAKKWSSEETHTQYQFWMLWNPFFFFFLACWCARKPGKLPNGPPPGRSSEHVKNRTKLEQLLGCSQVVVQKVFHLEGRGWISDFPQPHLKLGALTQRIKSIHTFESQTWCFWNQKIIWLTWHQSLTFCPFEKNEPNASKASKISNRLFEKKNMSGRGCQPWSS